MPDVRSVALAVVVAVPFLVGAASADERPGREVLRFQDPAIVESSGLVVTDDLAITTNDSGDSGRVFAVSLTDGETVGVTQWDSDPDDVESLAPAGDGHVWVADIGDNAGSRDEVEVTRVPVGPSDVTVDEETFDLSYPDRPTDAETLLAHPVTGQLFVASKTAFGGTLFAAPRELSPDGRNRLRAVGSVVGLATDGAFFPDGRHLILRTYSRAVVYTFPGLETVGGFDLPDQPQGEGISVAPSGKVYVSTEGPRSPLLEVTVPADVRTAVAAAEPSESPSTASPTPGNPRPPGVPEDNGPRDPWQWFLGLAVAIAAIAILLRSLRPR